MSTILFIFGILLLLGAIGSFFITWSDGGGYGREPSTLHVPRITSIGGISWACFSWPCPA